MPFSYTAPGDSDRDTVRFLLQDVTTPNHFLEDDEINWLLTQEMNVYTAAAAGALLISGRQKNLKTKKVGDLWLTYGSEMWAALAEWLRARGSGYQKITAGGLSKTDKKTLTDDSDWLEPDFFRDLHRHPEWLRPSLIPEKEPV